MTKGNNLAQYLKDSNAVKSSYNLRQRGNYINPKVSRVMNCIPLAPKEINGSEKLKISKSSKNKNKASSKVTKVK